MPRFGCVASSHICTQAWTCSTTVSSAESPCRWNQDSIVRVQPIALPRGVHVRADPRSKARFDGGTPTTLWPYPAWGRTPVLNKDFARATLVTKRRAPFALLASVWRRLPLATVLRRLKF